MQFLQFQKCIKNGADFKINQKFIRNNRLKLIYGDIKEYNFKDKKYKIIFGINVIYFWDSLDEIFKRLYKLLNKNGLLILFFLKPQDLVKVKLTQTDIFNKYEKEELIEKLKGVGFIKINIKENIIDESTGYYIFAYNYTLNLIV